MFLINRLKLIVILLTLFVTLGYAEAAYAGQLVFSGQNPAIFAGANPGNASVLMAGVKRPNDPRQSSLNGALSPSKIVEQSVLSQASSRINDQIFNSTPGSSGTFDLGGGSSIAYTNIAGVITLTVVNGQGTTVIGGF